MTGGPPAGEPPGGPVGTVLAFEGQGARTVPVAGGEVDLAGLAAADAQVAIVEHQVARARPYREAGGCAVVGQSLGEISALVVAGALDLDGARDLVRLRAEAPAELLGPRAWTMASVTRIAADRAATAAEGLSLWIIGRNGPADCIVVGEADAFRTFAERLGLTATTYRELPVTHPYHTPLMTPVAEAMGAALDRIGTADPRVPMISPTGPREVADAAAVRAVVVDALVSPVAWSEALTWAAQRWPDACWRECGPSASLHRFVWKNGLQLDWAEAEVPEVSETS